MSLCPSNPMCRYIPYPNVSYTYSCIHIIKVWWMLHATCPFFTTLAIPNHAQFEKWGCLYVPSPYTRMATVFCMSRCPNVCLCPSVPCPNVIIKQSIHYVPCPNVPYTYSHVHIHIIKVWLTDWQTDHILFKLLEDRGSLTFQTVHD